MIGCLTLLGSNCQGTDRTGCHLPFLISLILYSWKPDELLPKLRGSNRPPARMHQQLPFICLSMCPKDPHHFRLRRPSRCTAGHHRPQVLCAARRQVTLQICATAAAACCACLEALGQHSAKGQLPAVYHDEVAGHAGSAIQHCCTAHESFIAAIEMTAPCMSSGKFVHGVWHTKSKYTGRQGCLPAGADRHALHPEP